jgi:hypothetical protein
VGLVLLEWGSSNVRAQKAVTQNSPTPGLGVVKLDFLVGTKWGSNVGRKLGVFLTWAGRPLQGSETGDRQDLSLVVISL